MKGRFVSFFRAFFGLGIFLLITTSCEIGLGAAVDTEAPSAAIVSPAVKEAVGGDIVIRGTCEDDAKMDHLVIERFVNYDTRDEISEMRGRSISTTNRGTEWSFTINCVDKNTSTYSYEGSSGFRLPDGTYTLSMIAYDEAGRYSGTVSRSFDIDNTPPIFLLTKPNSLDIEEASAYGQILKITGTIADDHNIKSMRVKLYPYSNGVIGAPIVLSQEEFSGFDVSDTLVEIARYAGEGNPVTSGVTRNYEAIYDLDLRGTQYFYLNVEVIDAAGNVSENVYVGESIKNLITDLGIDELTGADMKKILNGSFEGTDEVKSLVRNILAGNTDEFRDLLTGTEAEKDRKISTYLSNAENRLAIKVNVANNPSYAFMNCSLRIFDGENLTADSWIDQSARTLSFTVTAGADNNAVYLNSINAYIYEAPSSEMTLAEIDSLVSGTPLWTTDEESGNNYQKLYRGSGSDKVYLKDSDALVLGETCSLDLPDCVEQGKYYIVKLTGKDTMDNGFNSNLRYGFHAAGNGNAPVIDAVSGKFVKYEANTDFNFDLVLNDSLGTDSYHRIYADGIKISYELYKGHFTDSSLPASSNAIERGSISGPIGSDEASFSLDPESTSGHTYSYKVKIPGFTKRTDEDNYTYLLTVKAKNGGGESVSKKYLLYVDGGKPGLTINTTEFSENARILDTQCSYNESTGKYEYTVSGTWSDYNGSGLSRLFYTVGDDTTEITIADGSSVVGLLNWNVAIPVSDSAGTTYHFVAKDSAGNDGNETSISRTVKFDLGAPMFHDVPELTSIDTIRTDTTYSFYAEDGYGLKNLDVKARKNNSGSYAPTGTGINIETVTNNSKKRTATVSFSPESVPAVDGIWEVKAVATDDNDRQAEANFSITVDGTAPVINDTFKVNGYTGTYNASANNYFTSTTLSLTGSVKEETAGLSKIYWKRLRSTDTVPTATYVKNNGTPLPVSGKSLGTNYVSFTIITDSFEEAEGNAYDKLYLVAEDIAGNISSVQSYNIYVDTHGPVFSTTGFSIGESLQPISGTVYHKGTEMALYGLVSDAGTGIASLDFQGISETVSYSTEVVNSSNFNTISWSATPAANGCDIKSWKAVFTPTGSATVSATATDKAGKVTTVSKVCDLAKDANPPVISGLNVSNGDMIFENLLTSNGSGGYTMTISGKWSDAESGTNVLSYELDYGDGNGWQSPVTVTSAPKSKNASGWNFSFEAREGIGQKIRIKASDVAGNSTNDTYIISDLTFDFGVPEITLPNELKSVYNRDDLDSQSELELTITSSDSYQLSSTKIKALHNGREYASTTSSDGITITNIEEEGLTHSPKVKFTSDKADGLWTVTVTAKDKAGRETEKSFDLTVDGTSPSIVSGLRINDFVSAAEKIYNSDTYYINTSLQFSGTVSEAVESGSLYYKVIYDDGSIQKPDSLLATGSGADVLALSGSGNVPFAVTSTSFKADADGKYNRLFLQTKDAAENKSDVEEYVFHVDMSDPELKISYFANGEASPVVFGGQILSNRQSKLTIYGEVSEPVSGLNFIKFYNGATQVPASVSYAVESNFSDATWVSLTDANRKSVKWWKAEFERSAIPNASANVSVIATDMAGRTGDASFSVVVDSNPPELHSVQLSGTGVYLNSSTYYVPNGTFTLSGVTMDDYDIESTSYVLKRGGVQVDSNHSSDASWSFTLDFSTAGGWSDGDNGEIIITARDASGNEYEETYALTVDSGKPNLLTNIFKANYTYGVDSEGHPGPVYKDHMFYVGGGQYSESSFAKNTSLSISGYYEETGSGIREVYYMIEKDAPKASQFASTVTYEVNDYVVYDGALYKCTVDHPAGSWNASHFTSVPQPDAEAIKNARAGIFSVSTTKDDYPTFHSGSGDVEQKKYLLNADETLRMSGSTIESERWPKSTYYSFSQNIAGFSLTDLDTTDVLYLVAMDNCGNYSDVKAVMVNVDLESGSVNSDVTEAKPTNRKNKIQLSGTAKDKLSGIEIIDFRVGDVKVGDDYANMIYGYDDSTALYATVYANEHSRVKTALSADSTHGTVRFYTKTGSSYSSTAEKVDFYRSDNGVWNGKKAFFLPDGPNEIKWELEIETDPSWFDAVELGASPVVYAIIKDWAGNVETYPVATLKVDTGAPSVTIASPAPGYSVNGRLAVTGSVEDEDGSPKSIEIYTYSGSSIPKKLDGWTLHKGLTIDSREADANADISLVDVSRIYNFSIPAYDFNSCISNNSKTGTLYVLPVACDAAGNKNVDKEDIKASDYITYTADLDTDRPTISFNEIESASDYIAKYKSGIGGIISDDDKISVIKISPLPYTTQSEWDSYTQPADTLEYTPGTSTVSFSYTPANADDGRKNLYIYVEDEQGGKFWTGYGSDTGYTWKMPYVKYAGDDEKTDLSDVVSYMFDSKHPEVEVYVASGDRVNTATTNVKAQTSQLSGIFRVGGTNSVAGVKLLLSDDNGIATVTASLVGDDGVEVILHDDNDDRNPAFKKDDETEGGKERWIASLKSTNRTDGQYMLNIEVTDKCGFKTQSHINMVIDNVGPVATMTTSSTTTFVGDVSVQGITRDALGSDVTELKCAVLDNSCYTGDTPIKANVDAFIAAQSLDLDDGFSAFSWKFSPRMPIGSASVLANYSNFANDTLVDVYDIPLVFRATDSLGNVGYSYARLRYNPYGDRPVTEIIYPSVEEGKSYTDMSGTVRISGTASDNVEVKEVFLQIAYGYKDKMNASGIVDMARAPSADGGIWSRTRLVTATPDYASLIVTKSDLNNVSDANFEVDPNFWGIKVTSTDSWYTTLNKSREWQNAYSEDKDENNNSLGTYSIWIRAVARDNNGLLGQWSAPVAISLNPNAPAIGSAIEPYIQFYDDADYSTPTGTVKYTQDMWIKGNAKLVTSAEHVNGIADLSFKLNDGTPVSAVTNSSNDADYASALETGENGYKLEIPLNTGTGGGSKLVSVTATEAANGLSKTESYTINYDNTDPEITGFKVNDEAFTNGGKLQNSNMQLTIGSNVDDGDSGFDRLLFYFYRENNNSIYDPQLSSANSTVVTALASKGIGSQIVYGKNQSITWTANNEFTMSEDSHIRAGHIVEIGGYWYRIHGITGSGTVTVSLETSVPSEGRPNSVFIPYAQVVDNTSSETLKQWTESAHTFKNGDDGDHMPESISKAGTTWTWDATLHGNYISDGPIKLVLVAMDKAGNTSSMVVTGTLQNNPPRLAKVYLGTDLDGNGKYSDFEFESYDFFGVTGSYQEAYDLTTAQYSDYDYDLESLVENSRAAFTAKDTLAVHPVIVGGNDGISLVFTRNADTENVHYKLDGTRKIPLVQPGSGTDLLEPVDASLLVSSNGSEYVSNVTIQGDVFVVSNAKLTGKTSTLSESDDTNDGTVLPVQLSFWDHTSGQTIGQTTQYSVLRIADLKLDLTDSKNPKSAINPFYWKSSSVNSLYGASTSNGHIELESDWEKPTGHTSDTTGVYDGDPKVSGKIKIEGYAYDEKRLSEILVHYDDFAFAGNKGTEDVSGTTFYSVAKFENGVWSDSKDKMSASGWEFSIDDDPEAYFGQKGHKVKWTLSIDTSKIGNVAKTDVSAIVLSKDASNHRTDMTVVETAGDGTYNKPSYRMDVVPYITSVKTYLSTKTKKADSSEYDRTAMGHYPVQIYAGSAESITIRGFNLGAETLTQTVSASGPLTLEVGPSGSKVPTLNNVNNNNGHGSYNGGTSTKYRGYVEDLTTVPLSGDYKFYTNFYNRCPNNRTNNNLTDDVYLDVWEINNSAAAGDAGKGTILDLAMKVNPANGLLGFAFANGTTRFSMPNSNNSNEIWYGDYDKFSAVALAYDSLGNSYATGCGGDINNSNPPSVAVYNFFTSRWGHPTPANGNGASNQSLSMEEIAQRGNKLSGGSTKNIDKRRIKSSSIVAHYYSGTGDTAKTNVYLAYYDSINSEIRFRWGTVENKTNANSKYIQASQDRKLNDNDSDRYRNKEVQLIAETYSDGTVSTTTLGKAGPYVSLDVIGKSDGKDTVVLVWYDGEDTYYTYSTNITNSAPENMAANATKCYTSAPNYNTYTKPQGVLTTFWARPTLIFTGAGEFCKVVADVNGGVHIAAQDPDGGDLRYAYLPAVDASYAEDKNSVVVDSYGIVGSQITIDVVKDDGKIIPYIGYYAGSLPKLAYLPGGVALDENGYLTTSVSADEMFTGDWEVGFVPTSSSVVEDRVNVALWKKADGTLDVSTTGTSKANYNNTNYKQGICYGNGTSNPALGYVRKESGAKYWVETAQKK